MVPACSTAWLCTVEIGDKAACFREEWKVQVKANGVVTVGGEGRVMNEIRHCKDITPHVGMVTPAERMTFFGHAPATVWLTGLSGSGKSTLAFALEERLLDAGHACCVLDGDNVRHGLNRDLGFSQVERKENIRRVAEVAKLFNDAGLIVISAFISPYRDDREMARCIIGPDRFIETYLCASIDVCEGRDPKGLYRKARAGKLSGFTGVNAPYEVPELATLIMDTGIVAVRECTERIFKCLHARFR